MSGPRVPGTPQYRAAQVAHQLELEAAIQRHGWTVQPVFPTGDDGYAFGYTIGLAPRRQELIVHGMEPQHVTAFIRGIIGYLGDSAVRHGMAAQIDSDDPGSWVCWLSVPATHATMAEARARAQGALRIAVLQVVMADEEGRWPWEAGASQVFQDAQGVRRSEGDWIELVNYPGLRYQIEEVRDGRGADDGADGDAGGDPAGGADAAD